MIVRKTICTLLCLALPLQSFAAPVAGSGPASPVTVEALQSRFPNARIVYLPESELSRVQQEIRRIESNESAAARVYLVQNADELNALPLTAPPPAVTVGSNPCAGGAMARPGPTPDREPESRRNGDVHVTGSPVELALQVVSRTHVGGDDDLAVVVFIIVGVVVIYALIAYTGKYFYDAYSGYRQCPKWWDITLQTGAFGGDRDGYLSALRVSTGVEDDVTRIGLTGELGRIRLNRDGADASIDSNYWMIGPAVRWYSSAMNGASYVSAELLAGAGSHRNLGAVSAARIGMNFPLSARARLGLMLGALYTDVRRTQGALTEDSETHMMFGVEVGTRF